MLAEDDDADLGRGLAQLDRDPDALVGQRRRHADVGEHDVGAVLGDRGAQRRGVARRSRRPRCRRCARASAGSPRGPRRCPRRPRRGWSSAHASYRGDPAAHGGPASGALIDLELAAGRADAVLHADAGRRRPRSRRRSNPGPSSATANAQRLRRAIERAPRSRTPAPPCLIAFWIASSDREVDGRRRRRRGRPASASPRRAPATGAVTANACSAWASPRSRSSGG